MFYLILLISANIKSLHAANATHYAQYAYCISSGSGIAIPNLQYPILLFTLFLPPLHLCAILFFFSIVSLRASPDFCGHMQTGPKRDVLLCSEKSSIHPAGLIKVLLFALDTRAVSSRPACVLSTQFRREDSQNFKAFGLSDFYPASKQKLL